MTWSLATYRTVIAVARRVIPLAAHGSRKLALGIEGRARTASDFTAWGRAHRDRSCPLVLFHAASAGELRHCEAVIRRLRAWHPDWQLAVTTFSPSGIRVARSLPVDVSGLLPWDTESLVAPLFDALAPTAIVFGKVDLWPVLALLAERRGIRLGLIAGAVRARSSRLRWPARLVLAPAYAALETAGAIGPEDAVRLAILGARPERIRVTGDPRYDAVLERIAAGPAPPRDETTLVAGSTWPRDERVLLEAFARVRGRRPDARLVLVPHEPSPAGLARIRAHAGSLGLPEPRPLGEGAEGSTLCVSGEVGPLALLYGAGVMAYVGGGFGGAGLHSVVEPAAWGVPIIVGPRHGDNADATRLAAAGAVYHLPARRASSALTDRWLELLERPKGREAAGLAARTVVEAGKGAADCSAGLVEGLV
jgi:3-deoxy-D-manno-octulosonic-acid transferase